LKDGVLLEVGFDDVAPNAARDISSWGYDYDVYSLLQDPTVQAFIGAPGYLDHKARRFPKADNLSIAENEAFALSDATVRTTLQKAYAASSPLYFRGQPSFDDILAEIARWSPKL
jgi:hypothetical protein